MISSSSSRLKSSTCRESHFHIYCWCVCEPTVDIHRKPVATIDFPHICVDIALELIPCTVIYLYDTLDLRAKFRALCISSKDLLA